MTLDPETYPMCYENDPEILMMSEEERRSLALSAFGMWADDNDSTKDWDEWRRETANASWKRIERILDDTDEQNNSV